MHPANTLRALNGIVLLTGQSGTGKDTQAKLLIEVLRYYKIPFHYISNGDEIRWYNSNADADLKFRKVMKALNDASLRQPAIFPLHFMLSELMNTYTRGIVIINGSPRAQRELELWCDLIKKPGEPGFFDKALLVELTLSDKEAEKRLLRRDKGRRVDTATRKAVRKKMAWYKDVREALVWVRSEKTRKKLRLDNLFDKKIRTTKTIPEVSKELLVALIEGLKAT